MNARCMLSLSFVLWTCLLFIVQHYLCFIYYVCDIQNYNSRNCKLNTNESMCVILSTNLIFNLQLTVYLYLLGIIASNLKISITLLHRKLLLLYYVHTVMQVNLKLTTTQICTCIGNATHYITNIGATYLMYGVYGTAESTHTKSLNYIN